MFSTTSAGSGRVPAGVRLVVTDGEPTRLIDAWTGSALAQPATVQASRIRKVAGHWQMGPLALPSATAARWHGSDGKDPQRRR
jgi:hypothetical protein